MCGIAGRVSFRRGNRVEPDVARQALDRLGHRGPDASGTWGDDDHGVDLLHRRLAVIDLSEHGAQPMVSPTGRYVVVYNGELYNFRDLRADLEPHVGFRGHSDTEVLVAGIERWGLHATLERANGMFGMAVWDRDTASLHLARDPLGEKPVYHARTRTGIAFASELKALHPLLDGQPDVDADSLVSYLRFGYVPAPHTIFRGVEKLVPGTVLTVTVADRRSSTFWRPAPWVDDPPKADLDELWELVSDAVHIRTFADVPVGAFLSGGIDSSLVVSAMAAQETDVRTFSIGFEEPGFDEAPHAAAVARHLGTDHVELYVSPAEARAVIPRLPDVYDEPFADQSAIPTHLVAGLARADVTVALSGDGGDELFGGYDRYRRTVLGAPAVRVPAAVTRAVAAGASKLTGRAGRADPALHKIARMGAAVSAGGVPGLYGHMVSLFTDPGAVVVGGMERSGPLTGHGWPDTPDLLRSLMDIDRTTYLPDDILVKVDRASMAHSLEVRVPLLDPRIVDWSRTSHRARANRAADMKQPLRDLLRRHVPGPLVDRPKMGFGVPIGGWLRGPLRTWADDLLSVESLGASGLLRVDPLRARWDDHVAGRIDDGFALWAVLMFQAWHRRWATG